MNEKLIEQLFIETQKQITSKTTKDFANKFTELIVKECANVLLEQKKEPFPLDPDFAASLIKEHFGVEK